MIKRLYLANGTITAPLDKSDSDIAVDTNIAAQLGALNIGDHCYLTLTEKGKLEVIKIRRDYSGYQVDRAQDNTKAQSFSTAAKLTYRLTVAEIKDATPSTPFNVYADGTGAAEVIGGYGTWQLIYTPPQGITFGGVDSRTDGNDLVLFDRVGMFGCCDGDLTGAPGIDGPFFYLTSQLYPQEVIEIMTPNPKDKSGNSIPPIRSDLAGSWWLLTQPSIVGGYYATMMAVGECLLYGGAKTYSLAEAYVSSSMDIPAEWLLYGGQKEFSVAEKTYFSPDCYPLEMLLFGGEVTYDRYLDSNYIDATITVGDMELI